MNYVAYYTTGTPYEREVESLRVSMHALGLTLDDHGVDDLGSWQKNTQQKAPFIKRMLEKYAGAPFVYLDVDALVLSKPDLFDSLDCDIAAHRFAGSELASGTVYFAGTPKTAEVVDRWIALCAQYPERFPAGLLPNHRQGGAAWDQRLLDLAIRQTDGVRMIELPAAYCYIVELSQRHYPGVAPIILHTRGSLRHHPSHK